MLVFIAVCLPLLIIMAAFAIDVAWMQLARTELRTATDAAARAGAKELSLKQSEAAARTKAKAAAARNMVAGEPLVARTMATSKSASRCRSAPAGSTSPMAAPSRTPFACSGKRTERFEERPVDLMFSKVLGVEEFEPTRSRHLDAARPRHLPGGRSLGFDDVDAHQRQLPEGHEGMRQAPSDAEPLGRAGHLGATRSWTELGHDGAG